MGFVANILTVLIASPGDVADERDIAEHELHQWNAANSAARQLMLSPLRWETHSSPQMGMPAQVGLNEQILVHADIVVGIFGTRIGTATADYLSGSVEEIKRHVAGGKLAMVYFSRVPVDPASIDHAQFEAVRSFKEECRTGGLYHEFSSKEQFAQDFGHHLSIELNKPKYIWLQRPQAETQAEAGKPQLSPLELQLLLALAENDHGSMIHDTTMDGFSVQAGSTSLGHGSARLTASLKRSIAKLTELGYITPINEQISEMTDAGFARADEEAASQPAAPSKPALGAKALELLQAGVAGEGNILHRSFIGGEGIDAGGKSFMTGRDPRGDAEWREALEELVAKNLILARSKALYEITAAGFRVAEELSADNSAGPTLL